MREYETITTHDIRQGDVILSHGMELLIDREVIESKAHGVTEYGGACFYTSALVLNWEEVQANGDDLLVSFIRSDMSPDGLAARNGRRNTEPRWTIQGNKLAQWARLIKEDSK
jgi:hypothetical protein